MLHFYNKQFHFQLVSISRNQLLDFVYLLVHPPQFLCTQIHIFELGYSYNTKYFFAAELAVLGLELPLRVVGQVAVADQLLHNQADVKQRHFIAGVHFLNTTLN